MDLEAGAEVVAGSSEQKKYHTGSIKSSLVRLELGGIGGETTLRVYRELLQRENDIYCTRLSAC